MATSSMMHLNAFTQCCPNPQTKGIWKHPRDFSSRGYRDLDYWTEMARLLEGAGFDALFFADVTGTYTTYRNSRDPAVRSAVQIPDNDPLVLIPALANVTDHLGFASTYSTTYHPPFQTAKVFSTLDHLTDGRVAWNIVTSYLRDGARNMGLERRTPHDERYDRADEYMEVCYKLWEASWEEDAVVRDRERDMHTDPGKVHEINHDGEYFTVPGPHLCEPSPQRTPVLYQAGQSQRGVQFAARHAEVVFATSPTVNAARLYTQRVRERAEERGRDPDSIKILAAVAPITGTTEAEARRKHEEIRQYVNFEGAKALYGGWTDIDLSQFDPDQKLEHIETEGMQGLVDYFTTADPDREWTIQDVAEAVGVGGGAPRMVGSAEQIADRLEEWFVEADLDGFNILPIYAPGTLRDFTELVVPLLQERGLFRSDYDGQTLRERYFGPGRKRLAPDHEGTHYARS